MDNRMYDNEFEDFLKNQANQHRMYPSDKLWRNIQQEVHGYRKWPALTILSVCVITALVIGTILVKPVSLQAPVSNKIAAANNTAEIKNSNNGVIQKSGSTISEASLEAHNYVENITKQTIALAVENAHKKVDEIFIAPAIIPVNADNSVIALQDQSKTKVTANKKNSDIVVNEKSINQKDNDGSSKQEYAVRRKKYAFSTLPEVPVYLTYLASYKEDIYPARSPENSSFSFDFKTNTGIYQQQPVGVFQKSNRTNSRLDFQFYLTPSISYRRLVDDAQGNLTKSYITALPLASNYVLDADKNIQHKSAIGYEVGFSLGYNLNKKLAVRSGLQFNMRQYNIDAFVHTTEPAAIALSTANSSLFLNTISGFRNTAGSSPIQLKNRYYEIALPVGIDYHPLNKKLVWGVAASVQPTYTFDKEPFIITANYKNYADGSQLMRNWNINTNLETYLGVNTGNYRIQFGPQFRYQLLPTMGKDFPIREYPLDLGLKLGIIRSLP